MSKTPVGGMTMLMKSFGLDPEAIKTQVVAFQTDLQNAIQNLVNRLSNLENRTQVMESQNALMLESLTAILKNQTVILNNDAVLMQQGSRILEYVSCDTQPAGEGPTLAILKDGTDERRNSN